jgi:hypothetical protein
MFANVLSVKGVQQGDRIGISLIRFMRGGRVDNKNINDITNITN